jgi:hypothetical protein
MPSRYQYIKIIKNDQGKRYYTNTIYPEIPVDINDIYIISTITDRLDILAHDFYGDSTLYWIISTANNLPGDTLIPEPGTQLRIPTNVQSVINLYNNTNQIR